MARVKNKNGTSGLSCNCGSWLNHWERYFDAHAGACAAVDCRKSAEVGAHVILDSIFDKKTYIIPLCKSCNQRTGYFYVDGYIAPANVAKTCEN